MKMDTGKRLMLVFLLCCLILDFSKGASKFDDKFSRVSKKTRKNGNLEIKHSDNNFYEPELTEAISCSDCKKSTKKFPHSIADKISLLQGKTLPFKHQDHIHISRSKVVPKESERIAFSQKYNPDIGAENDGFIPVAGPYGTRSGRFPENSFKLSVNTQYKSTPSTKRPSKRSHDRKHHIIRNTSRVKQPQSVQRRAQYRHPKIHDELAAKESISSENILGNGNFEIIKGGIFSDQDANEIVGSRRISGGFGTYIMPSYRQSQNRFSSVQKIQFPPFYQGRIQNPVQPMFYPRAPF